MKNLLLTSFLFLMFFTCLQAQWTDYGAYIGTTGTEDVIIDGINGERLYFENNGSTVNNLDNRGLAWSLDAANTLGDNNPGTILMTQYYDYVNNRLHFDTDLDESNGCYMTLLQSNGRLGIGVDAPVTKLHVSGGDIQVDDTFAFITMNSTSGNAGMTFEDNGANKGLVYWKRSLDAIVIHRNTTAGVNHDFLLDRLTGNIGLNRGPAEHRLDVAGDRIRLLDDGSAPTKSISIATDISTGVDICADSTNLTISRKSTTGTIDGSISMTNNDINLESFNNDVNIYARNNVSGTDGDIRLVATDDVSISVTEGDIFIDADNGGSVDGDVFINADDDVSITNNGLTTLYATNDNLVGIGLSAPVEKLDVNGAIRLGTTATTNNGTIRWSGTDFEGYQAGAWVSLTSGGSGLPAGGASGQVLTTNGAGLYGWTDKTVDTDTQLSEAQVDAFVSDNGYITSMLWSQAGDDVYFNTGTVGIGTAAPDAAFSLQVAGHVDITGELTAASDLRFKKNIEPLEGALDLISQLNPVCYDYRVDEFPSKKFAERRKIGLIAQEVEQVLPNLVSESGTAVKANGETLDTKSVNYMEMVPVLIKAVQELREEVKQKNAQLERMERLEKKMDAQGKEIAALKALLQQKK